MEVTLRKTKITASILKQMEHAKINQIWQYDVLGYFVKTEKSKTRKYALLKDVNSEKICIFQLFHAGSIDDNRIKLFDENGKFYYSYDKTEKLDLDLRKFADRIAEVKKQALELGQIFY
jgi:hypothetical protein